MIKFSRSTDYELIRRILTHPRLYPHLSDDFSPPAEEFRPQEHPAIWYVIVRDEHERGEDLLGLWMFVPLNGCCWEVHTALLPNAWGEKGHVAALMLPGWIWEHTHCRRIVTNVPSANRLALHFALKAGMKIFGTNQASFLKNGVLRNQTMLGISKPSAPAAVEAEAEKEATCQ